MLYRRSTGPEELVDVLKLLDAVTGPNPSRKTLARYDSFSDEIAGYGAALRAKFSGLFRPLSNTQVGPQKEKGL